MKNMIMKILLSTIARCCLMRIRILLHRNTMDFLYITDHSMATKSMWIWLLMTYGELFANLFFIAVRRNRNVQKNQNLAPVPVPVQRRESAQPKQRRSKLQRKTAKKRRLQRKQCQRRRRLWMLRTSRPCPVIKLNK